MIYVKMNIMSLVRDPVIMDVFYKIMVYLKMGWFFFLQNESFLSK